MSKSHLPSLSRRSVLLSLALAPVACRKSVDDPGDSDVLILGLDTSDPKGALYTNNIRGAADELYKNVPALRPQLVPGRYQMQVVPDVRLRYQELRGQRARVTLDSFTATFRKPDGTPLRTLICFSHQTAETLEAVIVTLAASLREMEKERAAKSGKQPEGAERAMERLAFREALQDLDGIRQAWKQQGRPAEQMEALENAILARRFAERLRDLE